MHGLKLESYLCKRKSPVPFQETTNNYWIAASEISKFDCIQLRLVRDTENKVIQKKTTFFARHEI